MLVMTTSLIPETAPFNEEQRAWLNGFLSGFIGMVNDANAAQGLAMQVMSSQSQNGLAALLEEEDLDDAAWHDSTLAIDDRMHLAEGKPLPHRLMAAMAQLDCGSCGYLCKTYSAAIASGEEKNITLCSPGGKETKQMIKNLLKEAPAAENGNGKATASTNGSAKAWSRQNPYAAKLIESRPLNKEGSAKDTRHVAIDLVGSGLSYQVGDALGIYPTNCTELGSGIVEALGVDPKEMITGPSGIEKTLLDVLCQDYCLKDPNDELVELLAERVQAADDKKILKSMLDDGVPAGFDVLDVLLLARGTKISLPEFLETLSPLNPRLYSIASSMRHVGDQVHLTVGKVMYERAGRLRKGVASSMLADRLSVGSDVRVFIQPNHGGFTVPADPTKPMIMIGPGTGIAPFMAFLQERLQTKSPGKNWLFFGDQREALDFLYQEDLSGWYESGILTRLDTAFSRDAGKKVYVQDRMRENAAEVWQWLQDGAHIYICGDASRMAADVEKALLEIIGQHANLDVAEAKKFLQQLAADKRYVRDVY